MASDAGEISRIPTTSRIPTSRIPLHALRIPLHALRIPLHALRFPLHALRIPPAQAGMYQLRIFLGAELLPCSLPIQLLPSAMSARHSVLHVAREAHVLPLQWNKLTIQCRDECGNPVEPSQPSLLTVSCAETEAKYLKLRERGGSIGEYELWIYGAKVGLLRLLVVYNGEHLQSSPALLECRAASLSPGRCYAFGPGLSSPVPLGITAQFTVATCDASGTR